MMEKRHADARQAALERMHFAKRRFSDAAKAALLGDPQAAAKATEAHAEIEAARAELAALDENQERSR